MSVAVDLSEFYEVFLEEAREELTQLETWLLKLEQDRVEPEAVCECFRLIHTLKGNAATVGAKAVAAIAHEMETFLSTLKEGPVHIRDVHLDILFDGLDLLRLALRNGANEGTREHELDDGFIRSWIKRARDCLAQVGQAKVGQAEASNAKQQLSPAFSKLVSSQRGEKGYRVDLSEVNFLSPVDLVWLLEHKDDELVTIVPPRDPGVKRFLSLLQVLKD